jgi:hypothetical protein
VEIPNRFAALENLDESLDTNNGWESVRDQDLSQRKSRISQAEA